MRVIRLLGLSFTTLLAVLGLLTLCSGPSATLAASPGPANNVVTSTGTVVVTWTAAGPVDDSITALAVDQAGTLWVGTAHGLSEFDGQTWKSHTAEGSPGDRQINAIAVDEAGAVWIGADDHFWTNRQTLMVRTDGRVLWAKSPGKDWTVYKIIESFGDSRIGALAADEAGRVWIDTSTRWRYNGGVNQFDGQSWITYTTQSGLASPYVTALAADRQGTIWVGTADGVSAFDGRAWRTYTITDGLAYPWVTAVAVDRAGGVLWFGTWGGGVSRFDGRSWATYTAADGLASNVIYTLAVDPAGQVWAGTDGGASKFDGRAWTTYTTRDGLPSNQVRAIAAGPAGRVWIGTDRGLIEVESVRWVPSPPGVPAVRAMPVTTTHPISWEVTGPRLADESARRSYAQGQVDGLEKTLVLDSIGEGLLSTYDLAGKLALDGKNGWLYVDQGPAGLAVVDLHAQQLHKVVALPETDHPPFPQADPDTGRVLAFRDNAVYIIDPASGSIVDTMAAAPINQVHCSSGLVNSSPRPINLTAYDQANHILYLDFNDFTCTSTAGANSGYLIVSYNMTSKTEVARGGGSMWSGGTIVGSDFYESSYYCIGALCQGYRWVWRQGRPWITTEGWRDGGSPLAWDPTRRLFYEVTDSSLRVFDGATMGLTMGLPRPLTGTFEGYDPAGDRLLFRQGGDLRSWPAGDIHPPAPEPLTASAVPTTPVRFLAVSPDWPSDRTLFGFWNDPTEGDYGEPMYHCFEGNQRGALLAMSQDGGRTWGQPLGGLRGSCERFTALAVSPDYARDHTLLAGVFGLGIFKSTDGGRLWQPSGTGLAEMNVSKIALSPGFARDGTAFAWRQWGTLYRSTDGGHSWQILDAPDQHGNFFRDFALSSEFDDDHTLMKWNRTYNPTTKKTDSRLHVSRDGGNSWEYIGLLPDDDVPVLSVAPLFAKWQTLLAYGQKGDRRTLYRSTDGGRSWSVVFTPDKTITQIVYAPDVEQNRPVFALADGLVYRSGDGGQTWTEFKLPAGIVPTALAISPDFARDGLLFVGTEDGRVVEVDGATR
jgi:photosystem II stability/assembly factor-like uncharacterized protein